MAVYPGVKPQYPNHPMYIIDGSKPPYLSNGRETLTLFPSSTSTGWDYPYGSTGMHALGNGLFYISHPGQNETGHYTFVRLCNWNGATPLSPI